MTNDVTVVILAAGQGTRMKSRLPKMLHRAGGKPIVRHAVDAALGVAAPARVFVVIGHGADLVRTEVESSGASTFQQTEQLGTGHAVMCGREILQALGGDLVVTVGDCPLIRPETLQALIAARREASAAAAVLTTEVVNPTGYGRIIRDASGNVAEIVEHKSCTSEQLKVAEINSAIYSFDAAAFWKHAGEIGANAETGEFYLTDMIAILKRAGRKVVAVKLEDSEEILGVNNRVELAEADRILRRRKVRQLMLDGVTIERPETVSIDGQVRIGQDTIIGAFTHITGDTVIGTDCRIGSCTVIDHCTLGDRVEVFPFSSLSASKMDDDSHAGPFARIRMGAHLEHSAHVGNFVELKKTRMGAGSKSMHLAYLGDSTLGSKVNVGAGTITCNYDGQKKHPTHIGSGAFVGSNSTLVAPLEIEHDAYIAAGSVVTHKVPAGSLAIGRSRQTNKEGWKRGPLADKKKQDQH